LASSPLLREGLSQSLKRFAKIFYETLQYASNGFPISLRSVVAEGSSNWILFSVTETTSKNYLSVLRNLLQFLVILTEAEKNAATSHLYEQIPGHWAATVTDELVGAVANLHEKAVEFISEDELDLSDVDLLPIRFDPVSNPFHGMDAPSQQDLKIANLVHRVFSRVFQRSIPFQKEMSDFFTVFLVALSIGKGGKRVNRYTYTSYLSGLQYGL
jgi:hypothetical protein